MLEEPQFYYSTETDVSAGTNQVRQFVAIRLMPSFSEESASTNRALAGNVLVELGLICLGYIQRSVDVERSDRRAGGRVDKECQGIRSN
ncbi:hypothetical protein HOLleu_29233 [Holothuria leucospilota]|uniref:Uncharacterized protein n=1 Tax=Holothuria leucospilota TaxID=206669 RepID=A0A9Q1H1J3_HOLLE|nr:hypothetical protein HOLleu_29233 [Holothuria leucospilota]